MNKIDKFIKKYFGDVKTIRLKYYEKLIEEIDNITDEAKEAEMLDSCLELMDRARNILTGGTPTPDNNWGMLDTKFLRKDLKAMREVK